jgi:ELWxxDGT repeat protein
MSQTAYFAATDGSHGIELWRSDGTTADTIFIADINPGPTGSFPASFASLNGTVYFTAADASGDAQLWKNDPSTGFTVLVKDFGNPQMSPFTAIVQVISLDGALYIWTTTGLWRSDGTTAGTTQISTASLFDPMQPAGSLFFFPVTDPVTGLELWVSDGTAAGTHITKDINPGQPGSSPLTIDTLFNLAIFEATDGTGNRALWRSDGTSAGTFVLNPNQIQLSNAVEIGNIIYYGGSVTTLGNAGLFKTDGSVAGTSEIMGFGTSPSALAADGSLVFFAVGNQLWESDGTIAGTKSIKSFGANTTLLNLTAVDGTVYFTGNDGSSGFELWKTDGTAAGTVLLKDINPGAGDSTPFDLQSIGGLLFFYANDGAGVEMWRSDGTTGGTIKLTTLPAEVGNYSFASPFGVGGVPPIRRDFDGNGTGDFLWQSGDGQPAVWLINGATPTLGALIGNNPGPAWHVIGSGDFNGDGKSDVLWQNADGQAVIWLMNGATETFGTLIGNNPGPSWHVIGTGDFNGDGKSDVMWQSADGQAAIWLMNGPSV